MKDFAKSIVCNTKDEVAKVGNVAADITTDGNTWFVTTSDGKKKEFTSEREAEEYVKKIKSGNSKVGNADYSGASSQDLKNWIRMMEQDIRKYEKEAKKYEWYGKNEKGTYGATQYSHATGEIEEAKSNIKRMQEELRRRGVGNSKVGNKKIKGNYITIDTSTGRVTFDDFAGKSFDISRIDSSAGFELRVMQQQINDFKKAIDEAKSLAKQNGLI